MIEIVWEFRVAEGLEKEFEIAYASDGTWAQLFRKGETYHGTTLLRDSREKGRYLTIDRWGSPSAFEDFKRRFGDEYAAIDARCEAFTISEHLIGVFERV